MSRLFPFVALLFAIAVFFLYIHPTFTGAINDTKTQIQNYDQALTAADTFQQKEAQLTQARAQIPAESLVRLNSFLPDGVDNVQLILDMDALAARSGITLSDFSTKGDTSSSGITTGSQQSAPVAPLPGGGPATNANGALGLNSTSPIDSLNLTFKATGTYSAFRSFLSGIETSLRPLDVTDLDISESKTGVYTYTVSVRIYWLR